MSIYTNNKEFTALYYGTRIIKVVFKGTQIIWQAIKSCFGAGYWNTEYPWDNDDAWKND